uniref:Uncharacterized protein n=1 Tax=Aegilops tauschii subsp. strangulata TaxID=200361 RepID=A0A453F648_AEGTS
PLNYLAPAKGTGSLALNRNEGRGSTEESGDLPPHNPQPSPTAHPNAFVNLVFHPNALVNLVLHPNSIQWAQYRDIQTKRACFYQCWLASANQGEHNNHTNSVRSCFCKFALTWLVYPAIKLGDNVQLKH